MRARIKAGIWPFAGQILPVVRQGTNGIGRSWVDVAINAELEPFARPENPDFTDFTFRYSLDEVELLPPDEKEGNK